MPDGSSDSFFYQVSQDGGNTWSATTAASGGGNWEVWEWHRPWNVTLVQGEGNAIRIAERENNAKLDVICLRNDGGTPTDDEYKAYLATAVHARDKLADTWGRVKSNASLDR